MQIRVAITTGDLIGLDHKEIVVSGAGGLTISPAHGDTSGKEYHVPPGKQVSITASDTHVVVRGVVSSPVSFSRRIIVSAAHSTGLVSMQSEPTEKSPAKQLSSYHGKIEIFSYEGALRVVVATDLENYVQGVLQSEVPGYFKLEAMKAQAVLARTYGLHPRLPHSEDVNVCDSFLHCQAFYGVKSLSPMQQQAINSTRGQILLYNGKPALAVFSACAGGHTENYELTFSDPITDAFPSTPLPYLKGVPEGTLPKGYPSTAAMEELYAQPHPQTDDAWSPHSFRWQVSLTANDLENHMHFVVSELQKDPQFRPFIIPPESNQFGHIQRFEINQRGVAGTAVSMTVHTSTGPWVIKKELTIRSVFRNPDENLKRLKSARLLLTHNYDSNGLLSNLQMRGFGSGHGVGLQQIGAQGMASRGMQYKAIIEHYYRGTTIGSIS